MKVRVRIPVRLIVTPGQLCTSSLTDLETRLGPELEKTWLLAQHEVADDGFAGAPELTPAAFTWAGAGRRAFDEPERRQIERRLRAVIKGASHLVVSPQATRAFHLHPRIDFRPHFDQFVRLVRPWWSASYAHDLAARAGEHFTNRVKASAWVVDVTRSVALEDLLADLTGQRAALLGAGPYLLFRNRATARKLRALDPSGLAALPALETDELVYPAGVDRSDVTLSAGVRLIFTAAAEPAPSELAFVEFGEPFEVAVPYGELFQFQLPGFDLQEKEYGNIDWVPFLDLFASWPVKVAVQPFTVARPVHSDTLRRAVDERAKRDALAAPTMGQMFRAGGDLTHVLPTGLVDAVTSRAASAPPRPVSPGHEHAGKPSRHTADSPDWGAGDRGLLVTPQLIDGMRERVFAASHVDALRREAQELAHIVLEIEDGFFSADRLRALETFLRPWRVDRPRPSMEILFAELDRLGALTPLFELLYEHYSLYGWMRIAVIGNVTGTRFEHRPEVQRLVTAMNQINRDLYSQITWDPATNELVFVHSGRRVRPSGRNNPNPNAGVIGWVEPYFTRKGVVSRPTKETLERLAEPTRRKVQELMLAMLCGKGETRTREQLLTEAVNAAAAELHLDQDRDFERVKVRFSVRVVTVERRTEHGLYSLYVTLQPVQKFGDIDWEDAGPEEPATTLSRLDAELMSIQVDHELAALTAFFLVEAIAAGGAYIIITGGWLGLGELVFAVSIREILYVWKTPAADRDLDGYLTEALYGIVDVLGFRAGAQLGAKLAGRWVTQQALQRAATKWIIYASKGFASAAALGATQVVEKFGDDLFHLSNCRRWSSPGDYLKEFGSGFAVGLAFEFVVSPALSIGARSALRFLANRRAGTQEAAEALMKELRDPAVIEDLAKEGVEIFGDALGNTLKAEKAALGEQILRSVREAVDEVVARAKAIAEPKGAFAKLHAEWTSRALAELFEAAKIPLGENARLSLDILIRSTSREEMDALVKRLLQSPELRDFLEKNPLVGAELLKRGFRGIPGELERFLAALGKLPPAESTRVLGAVARLGTSPTADLVTESGQTVETLLELVGQTGKAAEALAGYSKSLVEKDFIELTKQDFINSLTRQKQIYSDAIRIRDSQRRFATEVLEKKGLPPDLATSILKRDKFGEFVQGVVDKMKRNEYSKLSQMDDIARGRFNLPDGVTTKEVAAALRTPPKGFKVKEFTPPREEKALGKLRYPRYHVIVEDLETGMTYEWQVGTDATTKLYERPGIVIPPELTAAAKQSGKTFDPNLHDIEYDIFQSIRDKDPEIAARYGLPAFIRDVVEASDRSAAGDVFLPELDATLPSLHKRASELLRSLVDGEGANWVIKFVH